MSGMRTYIILLVALCYSLAAHAADAPLVRLHLPDGPHLAGKPISMEVDILVPNFFMSAPQFPIFDIPDAIVTLLPERAVNFSETIDGQTYSAIRRRYRIIPQRGGDFTIPPTPIPLAYAAVPGQKTSGIATSPSVSFAAAVPAGAQTPDGMLPLEPLEITQSVEPEIGKFEVGSSLMRTITITAHHLPAMMIRPPDFKAPDGVKLYRHDPVLSDTDGDGKRVESVTYIFETPGNHVIPALEMHWYNANTDTPELVSAPAIPVVVEAAAASAPAIPPAATAATTAHPDWYAWVLWATGALFVLLIALAIIRYLPRFHAAMKEYRHKRAQSGQAYFKRLIAACETNDPLQVYQALDEWERRAKIRLSEINTNGPADPDLEKEYRMLEQAVFSPRKEQAKPWRGKRLAIALQKTLKLQRSKATPETRSLIPALNP